MIRICSRIGSLFSVLLFLIMIMAIAMFNSAVQVAKSSIKQDSKQQCVNGDVQPTGQCLCHKGYFGEKCTQSVISESKREIAPKTSEYELLSNFLRSFDVNTVENGKDRKRERSVSHSKNRKLRFGISQVQQTHRRDGDTKIRTKLPGKQVKQEQNRTQLSRQGSKIKILKPGTKEQSLQMRKKYQHSRSKRVLKRAENGLINNLLTNAGGLERERLNPNQNDLNFALSRKPDLDKHNLSQTMQIRNSNNHRQQLWKSGSGQGEELLDGSGSTANKEDVENSGQAILHDSSFYSSIEKDKDWSKTEMDRMPWKILKFPEIRPDVVEQDEIFEENFVVITSGIRNTSTKLHYSSDVKSLNGKGNVYRFSFSPEVENQKSRLELTTCFTKVQDIVSKYNGIPQELSVITGTSCPISNLPIDHIHSYEHEIFIPKENFDMNGQYVLTQWHGSPDATYLRDEMGCIAQIPVKDFHKLCTKGGCAQGSIFNHDTDFIGLRYNQGGYPPLIFDMKNGKFFITARDDERVFIGKGGCPGKGKEHIVLCQEHPRQHLNTLWSMPVKDFKFNKWVKFKWDIKWSEYSKAANNYKVPGTRTSHAWIRVWMDGEKIVDWTGPCGRNDDGRVPYFKAGIYNPSGSTVPIQFFFRRYHHKHWPPYEHSLEEEVEKLKLCSPEAKEINQNVLKSLKKYLFTSVSSASEDQCKLIAKVNNLSFLTNIKSSRMLLDDYSRNIITKLIHTVEVQDFRLRVLEKRLEKYEKSILNSENEEADHDDEFDIWT